jgi:uncharacterized membrane protein YphA (DoxX/SURF4 family)
MMSSIGISGAAACFPGYHCQTIFNKIAISDKAIEDHEIPELDMKEKIERWLMLQGTALLRISISLIYILFGILKFFPDLSPAEDLVKKTMQVLTFGLIPPDLSIILLALWETIIGLLLLLGMFRRFTVAMVLLHMAGTFTPLLLFPELTFTLVGQYIIKNIIIVSAALLLGASALKEKYKEKKGCSWQGDSMKQAFR